MTEENFLALPIGFQLNQYTIDRVLGQGGFGIVYKAHHNHLDELVVIKEFLPGDMAGRSGSTVTPHSSQSAELFNESMARFINEGRVLVKLKHANIVRCRDLFEANGTAYLVMDFEDGLPFNELLASLEQTGAHFTEEQLLNVFVALAEGLEYVHRQGVLHRDIKPANVFIRRADNSPVLLDFGAAKQQFAEVSQSRAPYTEFYAPIEQSDPTIKATAAIDIHAFGGMMYRAVTGEIGHKAESRALNLATGKADPLIPAIELAKGKYSPALLSLIDHCLAFNADDRPDSMGQVKTRLLSLATKEETEAREATDKEAPEPESRKAASKPKAVDRDTAETPQSSSSTHQKTSKRLSKGIALIAGIIVVLLGGWKLTGLVPSASSRLTIQTVPSDATVTLLDIEATYQPGGVILENGKYRVRASAKGYLTKIQEVDLNKDSEVLIDLKAKVTEIKKIQTLEHGESVYAARFSHLGDKVVTASRDKTAAIWSVKSGKKLASLQHVSEVFDAQFNAADNKVLARIRNEKASLWHSSSGQELAALRHTGVVRSAQFDAAGDKIITGTTYNTATIWSAVTGQKLTNLQHDDWVNAAQFNHKGDKVVTASRDKTAVIWSVESGKKLATLQHAWGVYSSQFNHAGDKVLTITDGDATFVWSLATQKILTTFQHDRFITSARFSPAGDKVVFTSIDNTAVVWSVDSGQKLLTLQHAGVVWDAQFNAIGDKVVTASDDNTAAIWSADSGQRLATLHHGDVVHRARFNPNGDKVVTASKDGTAVIWGLN